MSSLPGWLTGIGAQRLFFWVLRRWAPILMVGRKAIISRHKDVLEVLGRDRDFLISPINGPKMDAIDVPFFLGMDGSPEYDREHGIMALVARPDDLARIATHVSSQTSTIIEAARSLGRLDVARELTRVIPVRIIQSYFGVPCDEVRMMSWTRILFRDLFLNVGNDPDVHQKAAIAAKELKPYMLDVLATREAELAQPAPRQETLVDRLLALKGDPSYTWLDNDTIRRNLCGLMVGIVETTNTAVVQAVEQLLKRPVVLYEAGEAARKGDQGLVRQYAYEALRFNPQATGLLRYCPRDTCLGGETIPAGTTVVLSTLSAMFDPEAFEDPGDFIPVRKSEYLHFGGGMHRCFGKYINSVTIPGMISGLLRLKDLRVSGDGAVLYDGPFPDRFVVDFNPS